MNDYIVDILMERMQGEVIRLGIPDRWIRHGTPQELHEECGFDAESILQAICK